MTNPDFKKTFVWMMVPTVYIVFSVYLSQLAYGLLRKAAVVLMMSFGFSVIYYFILRALMFYNMFFLSWNSVTELALSWNAFILLASVLPLILKL